MDTDNTTHLIAQLATDQLEIGRTMAGESLEPLLGLELTLHQLKIVLLVANNTATTGRSVATALKVTPPTVSNSVDKLVELGYLERDYSSVDRRIVRLVATASALRLSDQFIGMRNPSRAILGTLSPDDLAALAKGTRALRDAIATLIPSDSVSR